MRRLLLAASLCLLALPAVAAEEAAEKGDPQAEKAKALVKQYLDQVAKAGEGKKPKPSDVSKKLTAVKKLIHPKTLELIAEQEKKKNVTVSLAVWHYAMTDYWMKSYELGEVKPGANGTYVVAAEEKNWRVQEGGEDEEAEPTSYLVGQYKGKWFITDKLRNGTFDDQSIKVGKKGYFDEVEKKAE